MGEIKIDGQGAGVGLLRYVGGQYRTISGEWVPPDEYRTGGVPFDLSEYFPKKVDGVIFEVAKNRFFKYNGQARVEAYVGSTGSEVADDADLSEIGYVREVLHLKLPDDAEGETFKLKEGNNETAALAHNIDASDLETAIEGLGGISSVDVVPNTGASDAEGDYLIIAALGEEETGLFVSDNSLEDGEGDPTDDPTLEIVQEYSEQGVKFWAWGY